MAKLKFPVLLGMIDAKLRSGYSRSASGMLTKITTLTKSPASNMQQALRNLDVEASGLMETKQPLQSNPVLKKALVAYGATLLATRTLINDNSPAIQNSGSVLARNAVTAKIFMDITSKLVSQGIDPLAPSSLGLYKTAIKAKGVSWEIPSSVDFATGYVDSAEWMARMEGWGSGYANLTRNAILQGIENGNNPRVIADNLRNYAENIPYSAALNLTQTLQLKSYSDASRFMESVNGDMIEGRMRIATLDMNTCLECIALHGTMLAPDEDVDDHYNGRCDVFYIVPGGDLQPEFMQVDSTPGHRNFEAFQTGDDWFASLPPERQAMQASFANTPAKLAAYKDGTPLSAFVGTHEDDVFGTMKIELSLAKAIGEDQAKGYYVK